MGTTTYLKIDRLLNQMGVGLKHYDWRDRLFVVLNDLSSSPSTIASTKTIDISGTNAVPSAAGLISKGNLEAKGWTVTVST